MPNAACRDLVKHYWTRTESVRALDGINATFPDGALTAVVGPSGSGKSTLLRLLAALDHPTSGSVMVGNTSLAALSGRHQRGVRREQIGYVFQRPSENFVSYLSVGHHLDLMTVDDHNEEVLEELGIAGRRDHLPDQLSGGEQQRAAIAQVIAGPHRLVVADEPTAELDSATGRALIELVTRLRDEGWTFVIGTHDHDLVAAADHVVELDHGRIKPPPKRRSSLYIEPQKWQRVRPQDLPSARVIEPVRRGAPPDETIVTIRGLTKTYRRGNELVHAVEGADLDLSSGRLTAVMGRSGSGKTTLLNVIGGWETADSGSIEGMGSRSWAELAVVPQRLGLIEEFTVEENILYPARLSGGLDEVRDRYEFLIEHLGLDELTDRYPWETSIGQQQRVAVARALVLMPRILLADEPTGHQDTASGAAVFEVLQEAARNGTCCVVATHNEAAAPLFDVVHRMADGRIESTEGVRAFHS